MTGVATAIVTLENMRVSMPVIVAHDSSSHFEYTIPQLEDKYGLLNVNGVCNGNANITVRLSQCSNKTLSKESAVIIHQISSSELLIHSMISDNESKVKRLHVGMGTTRGGFQIKALSQVYRTSNGVVRVHVSHGSRIYTTLIAENYAGLRSVFNAKAITMDHTAPLFHTAPTVNIADATNATQFVRVTWNVADKESGIQKCLCGLGKHLASADLHDYTISETTHSCRIDNISLTHGDTVYASVICINSVELSSEHSSPPILVSVEPPTTGSAVLTIVPSSDHNPELTLTNKEFPVQTNLTRFQMQWSGFNDRFEINRYEYRLKNGEKLVTDWTDAGKETMVTIDGLHLQSGLVYSAEVRAVNVGNHSSDAVQADVLVLGQGPMLSGKTMQMTASERTMKLDWSGIFTHHTFANASYTLVIGTQNGYTDVIDNLHTTDTSFSFTIPDYTLVTQRITEVFFELTCAYATGMSTVYRTSYKLT